MGLRLGQDFVTHPIQLANVARLGTLGLVDIRILGLLPTGDGASGGSALPK